MRVSELMHTPPVISAPNTTIRDVALLMEDVHADLADASKTMMKRFVRRLPVTDEFNHRHGLVALNDVVRELGSRVDLVSDLLRWQSATAPA